MKILASTCLLLTTAALAACSSSKAAREANPAPCPNVVVLADAARLIEFAGDEQTIDNVAYTAEFKDVSLACRYYEDKPIEVSIDYTMSFGRGPKGTAQEKIYPYFVAVTRRDYEVIEKAEFAEKVEFSSKNNVRHVKRDIDKISIPRASENTSGTNFEIVLGFALTADQARFNRSGKSLKFPEQK